VSDPQNQSIRLQSSEDEPTGIVAESFEAGCDYRHRAEGQRTPRLGVDHHAMDGSRLRMRAPASHAENEQRQPPTGALGCRERQPQHG
jgi:hypothetical protein